MNLALAILIGVLYTAGAYLMMQRSIVKLVFGLLLLSNATNLLVFTSAKLIRGRPPFVPAGQKVLEAPFADPLAQALILTAIVISFGVLGFTLVLVKKVYQASGDDDLDGLDGGRPE